MEKAPPRHKRVLLEKFDRDLNDIPYFPSNQVILAPYGYLLSHYVLNLLYKFGMTECKSIVTSLNQNMKLSADFGEFCKST